jgi:TatD DNase family protein
LDQPHYDADREAVIARMVEGGVRLALNPGVDVASSRAALALARQHGCLYAAVGVHPHEAKTLDADALGELRQLAQSPRVVAVGEMGLDYYRDLAPRDVQQRAFQAQLALAADLGLPVIVHDRDAHDDVLSILRDWCVSLHALRSSLYGHAGVLHSFSGDAALAGRAVELGFYIGVSGPVTYKNAQRLRDVVRAVPLERLLIETDAPYLTPQPRRGQRNEPAWVGLVAQAIAAAKELTLEQVAAQTTANAQTLFARILFVRDKT